MRQALRKAAGLGLERRRGQMAIHQQKMRRVGEGGELGAIVKGAKLIEGMFPTKKPKKKKHHSIRETPPEPR